VFKIEIWPMASRLSRKYLVPPGTAENSPPFLTVGLRSAKHRKSRQGRQNVSENEVQPSLGRAICRPYRDFLFHFCEIPTVEMVGYSLSSLPELCPPRTRDVQNVSFVCSSETEPSIGPNSYESGYVGTGQSAIALLLLRELHADFG
jgi:hypothetical protein